ncbi:MAG: acyl-CoA synthetase [Rhodovibrionaceae bacterium]|nr:acyl-CoA synthetase [Rhodovibrionaceae bacterium]
MASHQTPYDRDLGKTGANYVPLTPLSFIRRAAAVYGQRTGLIHGDLSRSWSEIYARCRQLASVLAQHGVGVGDTVSTMLSNTPPMLEAHFGVPMTGAVLNALNYRLDASTIAFTLNHAETKVLITDAEFAPVIEKALQELDHDILVIDYDDPQGPDGKRLGEAEYEDFIAAGDADFDWRMPEDEWEAISLNYTSGTTGNPKGVVYHHRGAYMNAVGNIMTWSMGGHPRYLWTLPMFHCNGWTFPWAITAMAGTHICLRKVTTDDIYDNIVRNGVTHMCGAPIVMQLVLAGSEEQRAAVPHTVNMMTAAAPPPASVLKTMRDAGFEVTHVYGLTEVYGPATVCAWQEEWNDLDTEKKAELLSRQGVAYPVLEGLMVADPDTMTPVPADGESLGEVMMRGHIVMKGYLKNPDATQKSLANGWFHTGDLGVVHPDGYIQLKDRSKDIIISGGENISSIEVEGVLHRHSAVANVAVVARPDEKWGETPCAFVELKPNAKATEEELIDFCRDNMARFKCPRTIVFGELPKTSTGKIQKFMLRDKAKELN